MSILVPALGKHVTHLRLAVQSVSITGVLTDASGTLGTNGSNVANLITSTGAGPYPGNLAWQAGLLDEMELTGTKISENIRSVNQIRSNNVAVALAYSATISEILTPSTQLLAALWFNGSSKIVRLEFAARRRLYRIYMLMTDYSESYQMGKNVGRMSLRQINGFNTVAGDASPVTITSSATDR